MSRFLSFAVAASVVCAVQSVSIAQKSYSCVNGTCQLNAFGVKGGLAQSICLTTCEGGNLWPKPSGQVSISTEFSGFDVSHVSVTDKHGKNNMEKFEANFIRSLKSLLPKTSDITGHSKTKLSIVLIVDDESVISPSIGNEESYDLSVKKNTDNVIEVAIHGATQYGVRHGLETLAQLISYDYFSHSLVIPNTVAINDKPAFPYRGVMVDVSRHFISVPKLKETIDAMGYNKMNVLHLHLSDTASFPMELVSQPNVTAYGAYGDSEVYSVAQVQELVEYAAAAGVMILPEIDVPAHVSAGWQWGSKDPSVGDLTVCGDPLGTHSSQWSHDSLEPPSGQLNIANEAVYPILQDIYSEIARAFKSNYFHLGGDEVIVGSDEAWAACYNSTTLGKPILDLLASRGLDRHDKNSFYTLWKEFNIRATGMIQTAYTGLPANKLNKIHVWGGAGEDKKGVTYNMITQPDVTTVLPPSLFTVQVWDTTSDSITKTLIGQGYDVVLSNTDYVYLDCGNAGNGMAGGYWCQPYHEWQHVYQYIYDVTQRWGLSQSELSHIQGSETLIWTEMVDDSNLSQKLWPRSAALAEALWTNPQDGADSWYAAAGRMMHWRELLVKRGVSAEALVPLWCAQRDAYACFLNAGTPQ